MPNAKLDIFQAALNALKQECFILADNAGIYLQLDEAGNIWLGEGNQSECYRVHGWHTTYYKIKTIIEKEKNQDDKTMDSIIKET